MKGTIRLLGLTLTMLLVAGWVAGQVQMPMGLPPPAIWPQPKSISFGKETLAVPAALRTISYSCNPKSDVVNKAYSRFLSTANATRKQYPSPAPISPIVGALRSIAISIVDSREDNLELGVDESYTLSVDQDTTIHAQTVWGALHALESLSQLMQWDGSAQILRNTPAVIDDAPRFKWRGFMLDTARHFMPVNSILKVIDAIAVNKLNVFHWHISDAESFPLDIPSRPNLAKYGAYPFTGFSPKDVETVVKYAHARGVRVVPEVDTPGHTFAWGLGYPFSILNCTEVMTKYHGEPRIPYANINNALLDLTNPETYSLVSDVFDGLASMFSDKFIHLGGDEVATSCIAEFPRVLKWMQSNLNSSNYADLIAYYTKKLMEIVSGRNSKGMVYWQDAFDNIYKRSSKPVKFPPGTVVQVWLGDGRQSVIDSIAQEGLDVIVSSGWYLALQTGGINETLRGQYEDTWIDYYLDDPTYKVKEQNIGHVIGGEVCLWGEQSSREAIWTKTLPRLSAAAERLWSPASFTNYNHQWVRLMSFACRLSQRGFSSTPIRPDYCEGRDSE